MATGAFQTAYLPRSFGKPSCVSIRNDLKHLAPSVRCRAAASQTGSVDYQEVGKYMGATMAQACIVAAATWGVDQVMHMDFFPQEGTVPQATVWIWFAFLSLRSRLFGLLDSRRPSAKNVDDKANKGFGDRKRPNWCPPGVVFPIVWSSIALLRATSATMIWNVSDHHLAVLPLFLFTTHLCIGDTWNYINNAQSKLGVSALFNICFVWTSAAVVDYAYFQTDTLAGYTLLPMPIWLTIACALVWSIWDLNGREPLLPLTEE